MALMKKCTQVFIYFISSSGMFTYVQVFARLKTLVTTFVNISILNLIKFKVHKKQFRGQETIDMMVILFNSHLEKE